MEQRSLSPQLGASTPSSSSQTQQTSSLSTSTRAQNRSNRMTWQPTTARSTAAQPQGPLSLSQQRHQNIAATTTAAAPTIVQVTPQTPKLNYSNEAHRHIYVKGDSDKKTELSSLDCDLYDDMAVSSSSSSNGNSKTTPLPHRAAPPPPLSSSSSSSKRDKKSQSPNPSEGSMSLSEILTSPALTSQKSPHIERNGPSHVNSSEQAPNGMVVIENSDNVVYNDDNTIKYASMEVLINRMISGKGSDANFMNHFLLTMNLHTTPDDFLDALVTQFQGDAEQAHRLRVFVVLKTWVEKLWNSSTDPNLVRKVQIFARNSGLENPSKALLKTIDQKISSGTSSSSDNMLSSSNVASISDSSNSGSQQQQQKDYIFAEDVPPPIAPISYLMGTRLPPAEVTLDTVAVVELARQLALVEIELFKAIKPWEFQNLNFTKKDKSLAPNIHAYSTHFNAMSRWASWRILECTDLRKRVRVMERVIDLAYISYKLQNYNAVNELVSACTSSAVYRLHKTWEAITPEHAAKFKELSDLVAPAKSYAALRNKLHTIHPPCVPYIGIYQTDLTFIEEGNPTLNNGLINWKKCRMQASIIIEIQTYQQSPYGFFPIPFIKDYFLHLPIIDDADAMWNASKTIEPKEGKNGAGSPAPQDPERESKFFSSSTLSAIKPKIFGGDVGMDSDPADNPCSDDANDNATKTEIKVLLPGKSTFLHVSVKEKLLKEPILRHAAENGLIGYNEIADDSWKLMMFSDVMPFGVEQMDGSTTPTIYYSFFGLYHNMQMVEIIYPAGFNFGPKPLQVAMDYESPLFTLAQVLLSIAEFPNPEVEGGRDPDERPAGEIIFMKWAHSKKTTLSWLNSNLSLKDQGFDVTQDKIIAVPLELLHHTEEGALRAQYPSKLGGASYPPMKPVHHSVSSLGGGGSGGSPSFQVQLTKVNARSITRGGILNKQILTGAVSSFRKGTITAEKEKRKFMLVDNFLFCFRGDNPLSPVRVWPLEFCDISYGTIHNTQTCIALKYIPQHSRCAGTTTNSRPRGVSNGSTNTNESNDPTDALAAAAPSSSSTSSLPAATTATTSPAAAGTNSSDANSGATTADDDEGETSIESGSDDINHKDGKADTTLLAGSSESMTRSWFTLLSQKSRVNYKTRIFGESLASICCRDKSVVPWFLTDAIDQLIKRAIYIEGIFSAQPSATLVYRFKDSINAGVCPVASNVDELVCLAQCVLMFFTEMPEPAIPYSMYPSIVAYCKDNKSLNLEALRAIVAKLPDLSANALFCLFVFFKLWADGNGKNERNESLRRAAITIGQVIMGPHESESIEYHNPASIIEVATRFGEDILRSFTKLNLRRFKIDFSSIDVSENGNGGNSINGSSTVTLSQFKSSSSSSSSENGTVSVTIFSKKQLGYISSSASIGSPYRNVVSGSSGPGSPVMQPSSSSSSASPLASSSSTSGGDGELSSSQGSQSPMSAKRNKGLSFSARISQHFKRDKKTGALRSTSHGLGDSVVIISDTFDDEDNDDTKSKSESNKKDKK